MSNQNIDKEDLWKRISKDDRMPKAVVTPSTRFNWRTIVFVSTLVLPAFALLLYCICPSGLSSDKKTQQLSINTNQNHHSYQEQPLANKNSTKTSIDLADLNTATSTTTSRSDMSPLSSPPANTDWNKEIRGIHLPNDKTTALVVVDKHFARTKEASVSNLDGKTPTSIQNLSLIHSPSKHSTHYSESKAQYVPSDKQHATSNPTYVSFGLNKKESLQEPHHSKQFGFLDQLPALGQNLQSLHVTSRRNTMVEDTLSLDIAIDDLQDKDSISYRPELYINFGRGIAKNTVENIGITSLELDSFHMHHSSYLAEVGVTMPIKNWTISLGLGLEMHQYYGTHTSIDTTYQINQIDRSMLKQQETTTHKLFQKYGSIQTHLRLGYRFELGRIRLTPMTGINLRLASIFNGSILDRQKVGLSSANLEQNNRLQWHVGLQAETNITKGTSIQMKIQHHRSSSFVYRSKVSLTTAPTYLAVGVTRMF